MAQQYQVKQGETLSGIAAQYGVPYQQITGFKSGNPNLIYPGETLTIPDKVGTGVQPTTIPAQSTPQVQSPVNNTSGIPPVDMSKYAGWTDQAAIQADWNNTWQSKSGGGTTSGMVSSISQPQVPNFQNIYDTAFKEATAAPQAESDALQKEIDTRMSALNAAKAKINDNPYYSEATRVGRISKLEMAANDDIKTFVAKQTLAQQKVDRARADAQVKVSIASNQYNIESQQYQQNLQQVNQYLSTGMFNNATGADIAQISTSTGMSTSMVQSIIDASKKSKEVKPELKTADDGTNQYVVAIDQNGNIINKQIISSSKPEKATGTGNDAKQEAAFYSAINDGIQQLQKGEDWGTVWNRIHIRFPEIAPEAIDQLLGTQWRESGAYQSYKAKTSTSGFNPGEL